MRKTLYRVGLVLSCLGSLPTWLHASSSSEYVYVESNNGAPYGNSILAFQRDLAGQLRPISGSPFRTGGAGVPYTGLSVGPFDSDQEIAVSNQQKLLFAVNTGSNTIAVFHIEDNGALTPVYGSPFPSEGTAPVSLALDGNTLFVANQGGTLGAPSAVLPSYVAMRLENGGVLHPINDRSSDTSRDYQASVSVAAGSYPSQVLPVQGMNLLFGADFLGGLLQEFRYNRAGKLQQQPPISLPASEFNDTTTGRFPLGLWNHPTRPILYVGYVTANKMGIYQYNSDGDLKFIRAVPNGGQGICWLRTNTGGDRIYTTDTTSNQVSVYDSSDAAYPVEIQTFALRGIGSGFQEALSGDGRSLYVISQRASANVPEGQGNVLHTLAVGSDGRLSETAAPVIFNLPAGVRPQGIGVYSR